jgi:predicted  nucleic acid-binding Zn-ribbon protein
LALKIDELEAIMLDADTSRTQLEEAQKQLNSLIVGRENLDGELVALRKELENTQSSLLSSRTNQRVEEDRIQKAVQSATAVRDEFIKYLEVELKGLKNEKVVSEQSRKSDEKNIRELSQDKFALKQRSQELEEQLSNLAVVQKALEQELAERRAKVEQLEDQLVLRPGS